MLAIYYVKYVLLSISLPIIRVWCGRLKTARTKVRVSGSAHGWTLGVPQLLRTSVKPLTTDSCQKDARVTSHLHLVPWSRICVEMYFLSTLVSRCLIKHRGNLTCLQSNVKFSNSSHDLMNLFVSLTTRMFIVVLPQEAACKWTF
jgi:hypothetical protein